MISFKSLIGKFKNNEHAKQSFALMCWNFIGLPLGIVTNILITRYMGAEDYGNYLYIQKVFEFTFIIVDLGLLRSINRSILLSDTPERKREYYGSGLIVLLILYAIVVISLFISAFVLPNFREKGVLDLFLCIIPFAIIPYLQKFLEINLPADNRIKLLIAERYYPRIGLFVSSLIIYLLFTQKDTNPIIVVWSFFLSSQLLVYIYVLLRIKPLFTNIKERLKGILKVNREYGIQVYVGDLFSTLFVALIPLLISYFSDDNAGVGFYSLSLTLSAPLSFIPVVIATSHYSEFVNYKSIPRKLMLITIAVSVAAMFALWILVVPFVNFFYTEEFQPVIMLTFITSIGTLLYGLSDFYSRYLAAHGEGKSLRDSSFLVGFSTMLLSVIFIPIFHETGAAITHAIAGVVYMISILFYYKKTI